jgi:hypothetical protein
MKARGSFRASVWIQRRVNAGVLQLTLGIAIVISIICASMIMLVYYNKLIFLKQDIESELRDNAVSAIHYGMATRNNSLFNQPVSVDLFGEETDSVEITRKPWGVFEVIVAKAIRGEQVQIKTALITAMPDGIGKSAIYTPDNNAPLYLVGKTSIVGTAYLSERKLSTGYIDGKGYEGKTLITGDIKKSEYNIVTLDTSLLSEMKLVMDERPGVYKLNYLETLRVGSKLSFQSSETYYYHTEQSLTLSDSLRGNLIIHSAIKIRVTAEASMADIIVIAPDIDIDNGFTGSVQCFATRSITIGSDSNLEYPSALVLMGEETDSTIVIREGARVNGLCVIPGYDQSTGSKGMLRIEKGAVLHGMTYINGRADIQGSVWGHITARSFTAKIQSSEYNSHLLNAEINADKKSVHMPGSLLWANTKELVVVKWLE